MIRGRGDTSCQTEIQRPWQHYQFNPAHAHVHPLSWCPLDSCRASHWGLGVKVDLIRACQWTVHWVADCQMTFHTHLSTGVKTFRNLNFAAVPPIVSGREDRGAMPLPFGVDCHVCIRRHDPGRSVRYGVIPKFIECCTSKWPHYKYDADHSPTDHGVLSPGTRAQDREAGQPVSRNMP